MWLTMEIPHPEAGQPPRTVRGKVAWIQRPRTVRQLFQVALELEIPGNVWGIAFPPEDWFVFGEAPGSGMKTDAMQETPPPAIATSETEIVMALGEPDAPPATNADNVRVFPSPASTTDASLQLARQVARLVADAKQQIQAATREAASQAVSAERRLSFEQWEQKFAAGRTEIANEATRAIERLHEEADEQSRAAHAAAAEALRNELPRWLAPQLEQLTHELTFRLSKEGAAQRNEHAQQLEQMAGTLRTLCHQGEETAAKLKAEAEQSQAQLTARAEEAARTVEEAARQREETAAAQRDALSRAATEIEQRVDAATRSIGETLSQQEQAAAAQRDALSGVAAEIRQHVESAIAVAQSSWQGQLASEVDAAQVRWRAAIEGTLAEAQDRAAFAQPRDPNRRSSTAASRVTACFFLLFCCFVLFLCLPWTFLVHGLSHYPFP
jgi:ribosome recycling factor